MVERAWWSARGGAHVVERAWLPQPTLRGHVVCLLMHIIIRRPLSTPKNKYPDDPTAVLNGPTVILRKIA